MTLKLNALKRISDALHLWSNLDEMVTSDSVVVQLEGVKRAVIEDNRALAERLHDAEITIYPAIGQAYRAYGAVRVDSIIEELLEEAEFYEKQ